MKTMYCTSYNPNINRRELKQDYMKTSRILRVEQIREKRKEYNSVLIPCEVCGKEFNRSNSKARIRRMHSNDSEKSKINVLEDVFLFHQKYFSIIYYIHD